MSWNPACSIEQLKARAAMYAQIRAFFRERGVLEVETPLLSRAASTDPQLQSVGASLHGLPSTVCPENTPFYLQTSPEFPMKRLLASGSGPIFQICKTFRNGERGRRHNPEFSMLEWYRPGFSLDDLMVETGALLTALIPVDTPITLTYRDVFKRYLEIDPFQIDDGELASLVRTRCAYSGEALCRDDALNLLLSVCIEPYLGVEEPVFLTAYPASQASLAEVSQDAFGNRVAKRFELYIQGIELANGYQELTDAAEQARRFDADNIARREAGLPEMPVDERLLAAMSAGLPDCAGVAVGLDRLLMVQQRQSAIDDVIAFPIEKA